MENIWIGCGFAGWGVAQFCKLVSSFIQTRKIDFSYFVSTGGMPSAHSATVASIAMSIGLTNGFDSPLFGLAFAVAGITMFDASSLRMHAGRQARLLNEITRQIFKERSWPQKPLKELLGHTRFEVFMGMLVGMAVGACLTSLWCCIRG